MSDFITTGGTIGVAAANGRTGGCACGPGAGAWPCAAAAERRQRMSVSKKAGQEARPTKAKARSKRSRNLLLIAFSSPPLPGPRHGKAGTLHPPAGQLFHSEVGRGLRERRDVRSDQRRRVR